MEQRNIEKIILCYESKIRQFFQKKVYNRSDVDDLVQESICRIISALPAFSGRSHLSTWIYSLCNNVFFNYLYQKKQQERIIERINRLKTCTPQDFENRIELKLIIHTLSARSRALFRLFYLKKYSIREIAGLLNKPAGTVKYYLYQLRNELRKRMEN